METQRLGTFFWLHAGFVLVQKSSDLRIVFVSSYIQRLRNAASFLLVPHEQYYGSSSTTETAVCVMH